MRSANGIPPRVALPTAALTLLHASIGEERATLSSPAEPRTCLAPAFEMRESIHHQFSLKPSGFPFQRVTL
jgi:hypothetical protein